MSAFVKDPDKFAFAKDPDEGAFVKDPSKPHAMDVARPPRRRARRLAWAAVAVAAAAAVTVALGRSRAAPPRVDRALVLVDTVRRGPMVRAVAGQGALVPEELRFVSAVAVGRVERIRVRTGEAVQPETVLLELANADVELQALEAEQQLASAEAQLASLRASLDGQRLAEESLVAATRSQLGEAARRAEADAQLAARGFLSQLETAQSRDRARELDDKLVFERKRLTAQSSGIAAQLAAQRAQLDGLRAIAGFRRRAVEALRVRAGVAGVVQELPLSVGQSVAAGALLAKVVDPRRLKAELRIGETLAKDLQLGQEARIDTHDRVVAGRVARIDPAVQSGTVRVDVALTGPLPPGARPDLTVEGTIELERLDDVLALGRPAAAQPGATLALYKLDESGDTATRVPVAIGKISVRAIEIKSGLSVGDRVIISDMSEWDRHERVRLQ
jgi:multidrug resistance efflux pump